MQTTSTHRTATIRTRAIRIGAVAGLLTPVPVVMAAAVTLKEGENIRQYGIPWLLAASALLVRSCLAGVHAVQISSGRRMERAGHQLTQWALLVVVTFFGVLGFEDLVDTVAGTGRFLSSNGLITAVGTLIGSLASLVLLPVGLCLFGIGTANARLLPGASRWLPLTIPVTVVVGAATASNVGSSVVSLIWTCVVSLACAALGLVLHRTHASAAPA
jgi:hypothetical protein